MTLKEFIELTKNADQEASLLMPDGLPIIKVHVKGREIFVSDVELGEIDEH